MIEIGFIIFYLIGGIIAFRMNVRDSTLVDGWGLVAVSLYFSLLSWVAVILMWMFRTENTPPKWLIGKKTKKSE